MWLLLVIVVAWPVFHFPISRCLSLQVHGSGTLTFVGGDKYMGEWVDAKKHGEGELVYINGDRFKGMNSAASLETVTTN